MKKMGRPKVPKSEAKTILVGAMLSPPEAKQVDAQVAQAKQSKSKWIRGKLLEPIPQTDNQTIQHLPGAILLNQDKQPSSTGTAVLYPSLLSGEFFPSENLTVIAGNLQQQAATLKTSNGRLYKLQPDKVMREGGNRPAHFHFEYEPLS